MNQLHKLFRERQHLFNEQPFPQAWRRIERRLDLEARQRHKTGLLRLVAVAAGVFAIATFTALLGMYLGNGAERGSFRMETISSAETYPQAIMVIEYQKNLTAQAQQIQEGERGKKFR